MGAFDFLKDAEVKRQESFEVSTLKLLLAQLGMPRDQIKHHEIDLEQGFGWDWFNQRGWLDHRLGSVRIPEFNFAELWQKPKNHPISKAWDEFVDQVEYEVDHCLIFRCSGLGRMVATSLECNDVSHVHVIHSANRPPYRVALMSEFFTRWKREPDDF